MSEHKIREMGSPQLPRHVAIIMDGNGRWAMERGLARVEGHKEGTKSVRAVVEYAREVGIRYLTLYAFSTENWQRPEHEVRALMGLFLKHLESELPLFLENDIRLRAIGNLERLPQDVQESLQEKLNVTSHCKSLDLLLALSYGGRMEITEATKSIARDVKGGTLALEDITEDTISARMYASDVPHPDLLIRTSNEQRISNFLLWQIAYSEIVITPVLWPDFDKAQFQKCLDEYAGRDRRFGRTTSVEMDAALPKGA